MDTLEVEGKTKPIFSWCPDVEDKALEQIKRVAALPFVDHAALMPDAHWGQGVCIGGVIASRDCIVPNFVGVDIGCGMCSTKTSLKVSDLKESLRDQIRHDIVSTIPTGFSHNDDKRRKLLSSKRRNDFSYILERNRCAQTKVTPFGHDIEDSFFSQLGTLGGGNHFIEIQYDTEENIWIMLHSGSRNIGARTCKFFNDMAESTVGKYYSVVPDDIPFCPVDSDLGKKYIAWMNYALMFAFYNRKQMMEDVKDILDSNFKHLNVQFDKMINIHHNYASLERHYGAHMWVHRKGATRVDKGTIGIIPGDMGADTPSYIVKGLGNRESLNSCSHGAGRVMGRKDFNTRNSNVEGMKKIKDAMKGVTYGKFQKHTNRKGKETGLMEVSEAPGAYKDIRTVMNNQTDLAEIAVELRPLISVKDQ